MYKDIICGIYKITNPKNKVYIGQSISIFERWGHYRRNDCKKQIKLYRSLLKYGHKEHKFEILCVCQEHELNKLEKYYVDLFQSFNSEHGLNLRDGGDGNGIMSDETKKKISNTRKLLGLKFPSRKGRKHTEEAKEKMKESRKHVSDETRLKQSLAKKGKPISEKAIQALIKYNTGRKRSEETNRKIQEKRKGFKHTEETKKKISESKKGSIPWNKGKKGRRKTEE